MSNLAYVEAKKKKNKKVKQKTPNKLHIQNETYD